MVSPPNWTCPSCGAPVAVPAYCRVASGGVDVERIAQVTRAVCGCWLDDLPEEPTLRLLDVVLHQWTAGGFAV